MRKGIHQEGNMTRQGSTSTRMDHSLIQTGIFSTKTDLISLEDTTTNSTSIDDLKWPSQYNLVTKSLQVSLSGRKVVDRKFNCRSKQKKNRLKKKTSLKLTTNKSTTNKTEIRLTVTMRFSRIKDGREKTNSLRKKMLLNATLTDSRIIKRSDTSQNLLTQREPESIMVKSHSKASIPKRWITIRQNTTILITNNAGEIFKTAS